MSNEKGKFATEINERVLGEILDICITRSKNSDDNLMTHEEFEKCIGVEDRRHDWHTYQAYIKRASTRLKKYGLCLESKYNVASRS